MVQRYYGLEQLVYRFCLKTVFYDRFSTSTSDSQWIAMGPILQIYKSGLCRASCIGGVVESCLGRLCGCCQTAWSSSHRRQDKTGNKVSHCALHSELFEERSLSLARNLGTVLLCPDEHFFYKSLVLPTWLLTVGEAVDCIEENGVLCQTILTNKIV